MSSKDESEYTYLDKIFEYYINKDIKKFLSSYGFSEIEIDSILNKRGKSFRLQFYYYNLIVFIEFDDDIIDYAVFIENMPDSYIESCFVSLEYDDTFNIESFIENFYKMLQKDPRLEINKKNY